MFGSGSEKDLAGILRTGKRTGESVRAAVIAEKVTVKDNIRSVWILEALFGLKSFSKRFGADNPVFKVFQFRIDVGLQAVFSVFFNQLNGYLAAFRGHIGSHRH